MAVQPTQSAGTSLLIRGYRSLLTTASDVGAGFGQLNNAEVSKRWK